MTGTRGPRGRPGDAGRADDVRGADGAGGDEDGGGDAEERSSRGVASLFRTMVDDDVDPGDTNDQLAGEDAKLRAMRSVWLTMRDEEPSDGGLAVLMAAARSKAAELAPPTLWQRALAGLRRPPVLAFATVLVLLGGAVVVGRRVEREGVPMAASPKAEAPSAAAPAGGVVQQDARLRNAAADDLEATRLHREGESGAAPPASPPLAETVGGDGAGRARAKEGGPTAPAGPVPARRPAPVTSPPKPLQTTTLEAAAGDVRPPAPITSAPRGTPPADVGSSARVDDAYKTPAGEAKPGSAAGAWKAPTGEAQAERADDARTPTGEANAPPPPPPGAVASGQKDRIEATAPRAPQERSGAPAPALYRRCEAAAQRGDCVEVRRLAREISTTDRGYRARVTQEARTDPSGPHGRIARCLTE